MNFYQTLANQGSYAVLDDAIIADMNAITSYEHRILIAMPSLQDSWFEKTVIYIAEDNEYGTMGLVLNLKHEFDVEKLLNHFDLEIKITEDPILSDPVLVGGPVEMEHGFILHAPEGNWEKSMPLVDNLAMTVSEDLLKAIAEGTGPDRFVACLGFAGWEKGQLAEEMSSNSWLSIPYNDALVFDIPAHDKWRVALGTLGIQPEFLSMEAGHG